MLAGGVTDALALTVTPDRNLQVLQRRLQVAQQPLQVRHRRRHPTSPKSGLSALVARVMLSACPSTTIDIG